MGDMEYLSNRLQVSMGYRLINHAGCWYNTRRICKFTNSTSALSARALIGQKTDVLFKQ